MSIYDNRIVLVGVGVWGTDNKNSAVQTEYLKCNIGYRILDKIFHQNRDLFNPWNVFEYPYDKIKGRQSTAKNVSEKFSKQDIRMVKIGPYQTFTGPSVKQYVKEFDGNDIPQNRIILIHEDYTMLSGNLKYKQGGEVDGDNVALKTMLQSFPENQFWRIRVGCKDKNAAADYEIKDRNLIDTIDIVANNMDKFIETVVLRKIK